MQNWLLGAIIAALCGLGVGYVNSLILKRALVENNVGSVTKAFALRLVIIILFLSAIFLTARLLDWDLFPVLISGATGLVIMSLLRAFRLSKQQTVGKEKNNG